MAAIFIRNFTNGPGRSMTFSNEEWVRALSVGSSWTSLKFGLFCGVTANGTSNITNFTFRCGLVNGTVNTLGSGFIQSGLYFGYENRTLAYNAGPPSYYTVSANPYYYKAQNNVITQAGSSITTPGMALVSLSHSILGGWIQKGSPNYTVVNFWTTPAYFGVDQGVGDMLEAFDTTNTATWVLNGVTSGVTHQSTTIAFDESAGVLNTLNFYWNKPNFPLEVYGIYVARMS